MAQERSNPHELQAGRPPEGAVEQATETMLPDAAAGFPKRIGPFHVKGVIACGGMGTVYEAVQEHPRRMVALKVMKRGIASRSALRRFEYESQILARLHHPGIAQVYEAGTHTDPAAPGEPVPYFAMEYIPNARPITQYAQDKKLGTRQRLKLFALVCDAVHHGHQKGIVHRDLKPGNILVDSAGEVKIIDFGVARGTDSDLAVTTLQTDIGQLVGTLQYMSPEQCAADPHDIDTRSDVYTLGVVLYELLCGKLPYDVKNKPVYETTRVIRDQPPTRLSTADAALRGDIETIVIKALEKDRDRRYQSAIELAQDIRRYLAGEAIIARPPSVVYLLRVFARRNRALCLATAAVFVVLVAGVIISTSLYVRAERARAETVVERDRALAAEQDTAAVNAFLTDMLGAVNPFDESSHAALPGASDVKVIDMLRRAVEQVDHFFSDKPELEAKVRLVLALAFFNLGEFTEAEAHGHDALEILRRVRGETDRDTLAVMSQYAQMLQYAGADDRALPMASQAYERLRQACGPDDPRTLMAAYRLAHIFYFEGRDTEAEALLNDALDVIRDEDETQAPARAWLLAQLAGVQVNLCRFHDSEVTARAARRVATEVWGPDNVVASWATMFLSVALLHQGRYEEAVAARLETVRVYRKRFGEDHRVTLLARSGLGHTLVEAGQLEEGETLLRAVLETQRDRQDPAYTTMYTQYFLGRLLNRRGAFTEAEALLRECHEWSVETKGLEHPMTLRRAAWLAVALHGLGRLKEAKALLSHALTTAEHLGLDGDCDIARLRCHFGRCLAAMARYEEAERQLRAAYDGQLALRGDGHRYTHEAVAGLVHLYESWGKPGQAAEWRAKLKAARPATAPTGPGP